MSLNLVELANVTPTPWRNGGGATRELLAWPSAERWALRLSVAQIERDGPFSSFHGIERWFAVIDGAGVELRFGSADRIRRVGPADEVLRFDGGIAPACRLLDGPTQDLNLMLARGRGGLQRLLPGEPLLLRAPFKAVYVADAALLHRAGTAPQRCELRGAGVEVAGVGWASTAMRAGIESRASACAGPPVATPGDSSGPVTGSDRERAFCPFQLL